MTNARTPKPPRPRSPGSATLRIALTLLSAMCLSACVTTTSSTNVSLLVPPWPKAGPAVADELEKHCFPKAPDSGELMNLCPSTARWLDRLARFRDQLPASPTGPQKKPLRVGR